MSEPLNKAEKKILRTRLRKKIFSDLIIISFPLLIFLTFYFTIRQQNDFFKPYFLIVIIIIIGTYLYFSLRKNLEDLRRGLKHVYYDEIVDKGDNTTYGWHNHPTLDLIRQPVSKKYYLILSNKKIQVDKKRYEAFKKGDKVKLSYSYKTHNILGIEKIKV